MKDESIKLAQQDIDEALKTVEDLESCISSDDLSKEIIKEKFQSLTNKVQKLECLLKDEGVL